MISASGYHWELHCKDGLYFLRLYLRGKTPRRYFDNCIQIPLADERVYKTILRHMENISKLRKA